MQHLFFFSLACRSFGNWQFSPSEIRSDTSYLPQLAQFVFTTATAVTAEAFSENWGRVAPSNKVHYGWMMVLNTGDVLPSLVRWWKIKRTEGSLLYEQRFGDSVCNLTKGWWHKRTWLCFVITTKCLGGYKKKAVVAHSLRIYTKFSCRKKLQGVTKSHYHKGKCPEKYKVTSNICCKWEQCLHCEM